MNFQQLRIVRETVRCGFNLTGVAATLHTSQSGVSKHIKDLEDELGVELFVRKGKRLLGLTEPGKELVGVVERILLDAANVKQLSEHFSKRDEGQLTVATTHTQARYVIPRVVAEFKRAFPKVNLMLHQESPPNIAAMLLDGRADIGIATESLEDEPQLATFPFYTWTHGVVVPEGHPLLEEKDHSLASIAKWPIITYHHGFTGRAHLDRVFEEAGVAPKVVLSALDSDVIKDYVELGLGIGLIASMAYDAQRDPKLRMLETGDLFGENTAYIAVRHGSYLRSFAFRFIELCLPSLSEKDVRRGMKISALAANASSIALRPSLPLSAQIHGSARPTAAPLVQV